MRTTKSCPCSATPPVGARFCPRCGASVAAGRSAAGWAWMPLLVVWVLCGAATAVAALEQWDAVAAGAATIFSLLIWIGLAALLRRFLGSPHPRLARAMPLGQGTPSSET